jgi:dihydrodipicolinate synthase/N-acetylneuraminate lyase
MTLTPDAASTLRRALATAVVVPVTPYLADGSPDWDTYAALTARLVDAGISVITPNDRPGRAPAVSRSYGSPTEAPTT